MGAGWNKAAPGFEYTELGTFGAALEAMMVLPVDHGEQRDPS
jgi:hypothetical protein